MQHTRELMSHCYYMALLNTD